MIKKLFTILLSLVMTLGLSISSFAQQGSSTEEETNLQSLIETLLNEDSVKVQLGLDKIDLDKTISAKVDRDASLIAYRINVDKDTNIKLNYKSSSLAFGVAVAPYDLLKSDIDEITKSDPTENIENKVAWVDFEQGLSSKEDSVDLKLKKGDNSIIILCTKGTYEVTAQKTDTLKTMDAIKVDEVKEGDTLIKGVGQSNAQVKVLDLNQLKSTAVKVGNDKKFEVKIDKAKAYQFYIVTMEKEGYLPQVKFIGAVPDNEDFETFTVNTVKSTSQYVTGKGEGGAKVSVAVGDALIIGQSTVKDNGTYSVKLKNKLSAGTKVTVIMDKEGFNTKTKTVTVKKVFTKKLTVNTVKSTSSYITGKGSPSATIKAYVGDKKIGETKVSSKTEKYSMKIAKQSKGKKITVKMYKTGFATSTKTVTVK